MTDSFKVDTLNKVLYENNAEGLNMWEESPNSTASVMDDDARPNDLFLQWKSLPTTYYPAEEYIIDHPEFRLASDSIDDTRKVHIKPKEHRPSIKMRSKSQTKSQTKQEKRHTQQKENRDRKVRTLRSIEDGERYKILKAEISERTGEAGIVLDEYSEVACKNKSIKILEIQRQGKRPQKINEFMLGSQIKVGSNLNNA